jgi:hypothetical protein
MTDGVSHRGSSAWGGFGKGSAPVLLRFKLGSGKLHRAPTVLQDLVAKLSRWWNNLMMMVASQRGGGSVLCYWVGEGGGLPMGPIYRGRL